MALYFANTEITGIKDLFPLSSKDITGLYFGDTELFTVWDTYDGTLPATYSANGSTLADYRVYGSDGGVGDDSGTAYGYELDMSVSDGTTSTTTPIYIGDNPLGEDEYVSFKEQKVYRHTNNIFSYAKAGTFSFGNATVVSDGKGKFFIDGNVIGTNETAKINLIRDFTIPTSLDNGGEGVWCIGNSNYSQSIRIRMYDINNNMIEEWLMNSTNRVSTGYTNMAGKTVHSIAFRAGSSDSINDLVVSPMMIDNGITPSTYIPYLQPQDPPVPLPALPTVDGVTITNYAGQSAAPSRFVAKYRKEGFN